MAIKLFDIQNNRVTPTEHCYTINALKRIMDEYPKDYLSVYAYLFYMSSMNEEDNPFANTPETDKEDIVLSEVGGDFSTDEETIYTALELTKKLYETPSYRLYKAAKVGIEKITKYIETTPITDGRDGNTMGYLKYLEKYDEVCRSFEARWKAFKEEQSILSRGGQTIGYDQT